MISPDEAHEIRNAIFNYRGLRKQMHKLMLAQFKVIEEFDKQVIRIELAIGGTKPIQEEKVSWWVRLRKKMSWG